MINILESQITIGDRKSNYYAELRIYDRGVRFPLDVCEYLYAPDRGDDILADVIGKIQDLANFTNRHITHTYHAMGKASKALIERNPQYGYTYIRTEYKFGSEFDEYTKQYSPEQY